MAGKDILDREDIAVHTREVLRLSEKLRENEAAGVLIAVEIGQHVVEVRGRLEDKAFKRWLKKRLEMKERWAEEHMNLALVHAQNPEWVREIGRLGKTKAMVAARASVPFRWTLSSAWAWNGKKASKMTCDQFEDAVKRADPGAKDLEDKPRIRKPAAPKSMDDVMACVEAYWKLSTERTEWRRLADWILLKIGAPVPGMIAPPTPGASPAAVPAGAPATSVAAIEGRRTHTFRP